MNIRSVLRPTVGRILFILFSTLTLASCTESAAPVLPPPVKNTESSVDTAMKVPPPDFITACAGLNGKNLEDYVHPRHGFWFLKGGWFHPYFIRLRDLPKLTKQEKLKFSGVKMDTLPKVDCNLPAPHWTKNGCFASKENTFLKEVDPLHCELKKEDEDAIIELAHSIRWTVINTREGKYYFSLISGKWYLTFVDLRLQCETQ